MTAIFPLFHVCWSFLVVQLIKIVPALKKIFRVVFLVYIVHEILITIKFQLNYNTGDVELYNLLHGRSSILYDYSDYIDDKVKKGDRAPYLKIDSVNSVFVTGKYETPITAWAHSPKTKGDKITALFPAF